MQFEYVLDVGPLPLRFGMARDVVDALFRTFDIPSAYANRTASPQNAMGAYPEYDESGSLCCVEFSTRCSVIYYGIETLDDECDDLLSHLSTLFGDGGQIGGGWLFSGVDAFAALSGGKVASLLVFTRPYRLRRFGG